MSVLKESNTSSVDVMDTYLETVYSINTYRSQTFTPSDNHVLEIIQLNLAKNWGNNVAITVELRSTSLSKPTNIVLATLGTVNSSTLGASNAYITFNAATYSLTSGVMYAIVFYYGAPLVGGDAVILSLGNLSSQYTGGEAYYSNDGLTWNSSIYAADLHFKEYAQSVSPSLSKATNPTPNSPSSNIDVQHIGSNVFGSSYIAWKNGGGATKYNIYYNFGNPAGDVYFVGQITTPSSAVGYDSLFSIPWAIARVGQFEQPSMLNWLDHNKQYKWLIDALDDSDNKVTGDEWNFTTAQIYYPLPPVSPTGTWPATLPDYWNEDPEIKTGDTLVLGNNGQSSYKRLVACASGKFFYENI